MIKKLSQILILALIITNSLLSPAMAKAQDSKWWAPNYKEFTDKVQNENVPDNEIFGERYTHAQVWWVVYSLMSFAIEHKISDCITKNPDILNSFIACATADASSPNLASGGLGFLEFARMSDSMLKIKPASGTAYVASVLDRVGVPSAYAQEGGFGFNALAPVLGLWQSARNGSYALVTLAVIVLAFMIMFRTRISPQASVSVQVAIPRVIIGLILITFSYAIAGFVIDLSYVVLAVIAGVVSQSNISSNDPVSLFNMVNDIGGGIFNFGMAVVFLTFRSFGSVGGVAASFGSFGAIPVAATVLVFLVALILIVLAVVKIFWIFLRTYVMVILHVVALPFAALAYIASPSSNMFMQVMRSLIGNVSVFVSVAVSVMVAHILLWGMTGAGTDIIQIGNVYGVAPLGGGGIVALPGFSSGTDASTLGLFVGLITLLMAPSIANNIKSLIISGRPAREGFSAIGAGTAAAIGGFAGAGLRTGAGAVIAEPGIAGTRVAGIVGRLPYTLRSAAASSLGYRGPVTPPTGAPKPGAGSDPKDI